MLGDAAHDGTGGGFQCADQVKIWIVPCSGSGLFSSDLYAQETLCVQLIRIVVINLGFSSSHSEARIAVSALGCSERSLEYKYFSLRRVSLV